VPVSASVLGYAGALRLTVAADAGVVRDPGEIVALFEEEAGRIATALLGAGPPPT
jgi:hypothetical protein